MADDSGWPANSSYYG